MTSRSPQRPNSYYAKIVIIGSGAGGSTVARVLSEKENDILMIEEGPFVKDVDFTSSMVDSFKTLYRQSAMTPILGKNPIAFSEGRCVGGSTVVNGALMWKMPDEIIEKWQRNHGMAWLSKEYNDSSYKFFSKELSIMPAVHGRGGATSDLLKSAAEKLKWDVERVPRAHKGCIDNNRCPMGCPSNKKQSMMTTFIPTAIDNGVRLVANLKVLKIKFEGGKARYLECFDKESKQEVIVKFDNLYLSCGATQTPALLNRSKYKHPCLGKNLRLNLNFKIPTFFSNKIYAQNGTMMSECLIEFRKDGYSIGSSNFIPSLFMTSIIDHWDILKDRIRSFDDLSMLLILIKSRSVGRIIFTPFGPYPFFTINQQDRFTIGQAVKTLYALTKEMGAKGMLLPIKKTPMIKEMSDINNIDWSNPFNLQSVHMCGTAAIDKNANYGVVDEKGQLRGTNNVFVADASILPEMPGVNPQVTIMTMAKGIAEGQL